MPFPFLLFIRGLRINKIIVGIGILVVLFIISRPDTMPMGVLSVHDKTALIKNTDLVGGYCLAEKCLIIYVAPWCPVCHKITPTIISLVDVVKKEGVSVTVIVGKDNPINVVAYANKFPFPVLTDENGSYFKEAELDGVPYFAVTNRDGEVMSDFYGGYVSVSAFRNKLDI